MPIASRATVKEGHGGHPAHRDTVRRQMPLFFRTTQHGEYSSPRTVLGFYAGVLVILEAGIIGAVAVLVTNSDLHYLIPWVLVFGAVVLVGLIVVVVAMNVRDPTKLQLGRVTGKEFLAYQRVTRGDSIAGEYVDEVASPAQPIAAIGAAPLALEKVPEGAEEDKAIDSMPVEEDE